MRVDAACLLLSRACCPPPTPADARRAICAARGRALRCRVDTPKSNLMLPTTCVRAGSRRSTRIAPHLRALCAAMKIPCESVSRNRPDQPPITVHRARRDARTGQHQRHAETSAAVVEIRPDLGLENDREPRLHALEKTPHRARQVDGHVAHVDACSEHGLGARAPRGRDGGQHQRDQSESASAALRRVAPPPALRPPTPRAPRCCAGPALSARSPNRCEKPCQWLRSRKPRSASAPIHNGEIR